MAAPASSALADLVTQAVDERPPEAASAAPANVQQQAPQQKQQQCTGSAWFCRCLGGGKAKSQQNLAAVVPCDAAPATKSAQEIPTATPPAATPPAAPATPPIATPPTAPPPVKVEDKQVDQEKQHNHEKPQPPAPRQDTCESNGNSGGAALPNVDDEQAHAAKAANSQVEKLHCEKPQIRQLGPQSAANLGRKTLVLDLDETLVHSSFRPVATADITITVEIEGESHQVYVRKRPGCDEFLVMTAQLYEIVIYTASMSKYADPLLDKLDKHNTCNWRLFREACTKFPEGYVKDLSRLGRDLKDVIIVDNSPVCYMLQPHNAIPIRTWRDDVNDRELFDLIPILQSLADVDDIPQVLSQIIWSADDGEQEPPPPTKKSSSRHR